jgi:hypothetical protein
VGGKHDRGDVKHPVAFPVWWQASTLGLGVVSILLPISAVYCALQGWIPLSNALAVLLVVVMAVFVVIQFVHFGSDGRPGRSPNKQ